MDWPSICQQIKYAIITLKKIDVYYLQFHHRIYSTQLVVQLTPRSYNLLDMYVRIHKTQPDHRTTNSSPKKIYYAHLQYTIYDLL
jgi:hypothetical protein